MMFDIFSSQDSSHILVEKYREKKAKNPSFSIRAWANSLGLNSHGALQQILAGKRTVPKKYIPLLIKSLELTKNEAIYLETIIDFEKAKSHEERNLYYDRMLKFRKRYRPLKIAEIENYKYLENPLHSIVRTMIERKDFKNDATWIKSKLRYKTNSNEIKDVIDRIIELNLAKEVGNNKLEKTQPHTVNKIDRPSKAVENFHKKMSLLAAEEISEQSIDEREYNSFCLNIEKNKIPDAKKSIRDFIKQFILEFEAPPGSALDTYHLNVQLFSLTKDQEVQEVQND